MIHKSMLPSAFADEQKEYDSLDTLHSQITRLFQDFSAGLPWSSQSAENPFIAGFGNIKVNLSETRDQLEVTAELPGVAQEDINITLMDDMLTLTAEKTLEKEDKTKDGEKDYHLVERSYGSLRRSLRLPFNPQSDAIEASFQNGVLTLLIPKPIDATLKSKKIPIR